MFNYLEAHWTTTLKQLIEDHHNVVMVTVVNVEGSAPRESSSRMFVLPEQIIETIGGGNLEYEAITLARRMLNEENDQHYCLELYGLGPALNQCCGGAVTLAFEVFTSVPSWLNESEQYLSQYNSILVTRFTEDTANRNFHDDVTMAQTNLDDRVLIERFNLLMPDVVIFGAGHVGSALVEVLSRLPFKISWVDEREDLFADELPLNVTKFTGASWQQLVKRLPHQALNIIMTHSHELDEDICFSYLNEMDFYFLGLIGSKTKRARFLHRLRDRGIDQQRLGQLTCPIGVPEVTGSTPAEIAISVAAQLLNLRDKITLDSAFI